jgi:hypothetical protein
VEIRRRGAVRSAHSGRELAELHARVTTVDPEMNRWLSAALRARMERGVRGVDAEGELAGRWQLSWNAYGESGGVHTYTLILREHEELALEALMVDGVELHPYEYREELLGDGLAVWAKMVGTVDDVHRLRERLRGRASISVVRRGVQDEPRGMRLGLAEWSEYEDRVKYRLVLVENGVDESAHPDLARMERENNRAALGFYLNLAERLLELMVRKGILAAEEVAAAREEAAAFPAAVRHDFWHVVADIDEL